VGVSLTSAPKLDNEPPSDEEPEEKSEEESADEGTSSYKPFDLPASGRISKPSGKAPAREPSSSAQSSKRYGFQGPFSQVMDTGASRLVTRPPLTTPTRRASIVELAGAPKSVARSPTAASRGAFGLPSAAASQRPKPKARPPSPPQRQPDFGSETDGASVSALKLLGPLGATYSVMFLMAVSFVAGVLAASNDTISSVARYANGLVQSAVTTMYEYRWGLSAAINAITLILVFALLLPGRLPIRRLGAMATAAPAAGFRTALRPIEQISEVSRRAHRNATAGLPLRVRLSILYAIAAAQFIILPSLSLSVGAFVSVQGITYFSRGMVPPSTARISTLLDPEEIKEFAPDSLEVFVSPIISSAAVEESGAVKAIDITKFEEAMAKIKSTPAGILGKKGEGDVVCLADTGAGACMGNKKKQFVPGSLYRSPCDVSGSLGVHATEYRGTLITIFETFGESEEHHGFAQQLTPHSILNEECEFILISLGSWSKLFGTAFELPAWGGDGTLSWPDGRRCRTINDDVVVLPLADRDEVAATAAQVVPAGVKGVIQGKRTAISHVDHKFIHESWVHAHFDCLKHIHTALKDVPEAWVKVLRDEPCDVCLRAVAPRLGPTGHFQVNPGFLCWDIWSTKVKFVHGGHRYLIGFTHPESGVRKSFRMRKKSQALEGIKAGYNFFNSALKPRGLRIDHGHTDNAWELAKLDEVRDFVQNQMKCRFTTIPAGVSRSNPQERSWRSGSERCREALLGGDDDEDGMPAEWWGYAWDMGEYASWHTPSRDPPHKTPWEVLTSEKPSGDRLRPPFCLSYVNDPRPGDKVSTGERTALRGLHVGYNITQFDAPGCPQLLNASNSFAIYVPQLAGGRGRVWVGTDVRFVPSIKPGLRIKKEGGYEIEYVPSIDEVRKRDLPSSKKPDPSTTVTDVGDKKEALKKTIFDLEPVRRSLFDDDEPDSEADDVDDAPRSENKEEEVDIDTIDPDPAPEGSVIYILYNPDGKYYEASVIESFRTKTKKEWRHVVKWATTDGVTAWNPSTLNLVNEEWSKEPTVVDDQDKRRIAFDDDGKRINKDYADYKPGGDGEQPVPIAHDGEDAGTSQGTPPPPAEDHEEEHAEPEGLRDMTSGLSIAERVKLRRLGHSRALPAVERFCKTAAAAMIPATCLNELEKEAATTVIIAAAAGPGSDTEREARKEYAALCAFAATQSVALPPYQETYACSNGEVVEEDRIFDIAFDSVIITAGRVSSIDAAEVIMAAKSSGQTRTDAFGKGRGGGKGRGQQGRGGRTAKHKLQKTGGIVSYRAQIKSNRANEWYDSRIKEINTLFKSAVTLIRPDDPIVKQFLDQGGKICDTMLIGKEKFDADGNVIQLKNRCVFRGDQLGDYVSVNDKGSPCIRSNGIRTCEANATIREQNTVDYDYVGAYLQGKQHRLVIARAPHGHRELDEDGAEMLWLVSNPLYGQPDAGKLWNNTMNEFLCDEKAGCGMERCDVEPSLYDKRVGENMEKHVSTPVYVDDGRLYSDPTASATEERDDIQSKIGTRFDVKFGEENQAKTYMLSANLTRYSSSCRSVSAKSYIERIVKDLLPEPLDSYPAAWTENPSGKELASEYEHALQKTDLLEGDEYDKYGTLVGAIGYAAVNWRPDVSHAWGVGGRCRTFPTAGMSRCMIRVLVYLGRNAGLEIFYSGHGEDAKKLIVKTDSDWAIRRSTTGHHTNLAGGCIDHKSCRQHCIAVSSTEAELMALADAALCTEYTMAVLSHIGYDFDAIDLQLAKPEAHKIYSKVSEDVQHGAVEVYTDNKGAHDLCKRTTVGPNSRHVERKVFKMRELYHAGKVTVKLVPTADNSSDLLTKALPNEVFKRHRATIFNSAAKPTGATALHAKTAAAAMVMSAAAAAAQFERQLARTGYSVTTTSES